VRNAGWSAFHSGVQLPAQGSQRALLPLATPTCLACCTMLRMVLKSTGRDQGDGKGHRGKHREQDEGGLGQYKRQRPLGSIDPRTSTRQRTQACCHAHPFPASQHVALQDQGWARHCTRLRSCCHDRNNMWHQQHQHMSSQAAQLVPMPTAPPCGPGYACSCPTASPTVTANPAASSSTHLAGALWVQAEVNTCAGAAGEGQGSYMSTAGISWRQGCCRGAGADGTTHAALLHAILDEAGSSLLQALSHRRDPGGFLY
jgi:hypothetical protein